MFIHHVLLFLFILTSTTFPEPSRSLAIPQELHNFTLQDHLITYLTKTISPSSSSSSSSFSSSSSSSSLVTLSPSTSQPISSTPTSPPSTPTTSPLVPAFFIIGDSSVDAGNNNYLATFARADRPPYGRDFDTHKPTGRFCNGRIPVDYLALRLGLPFVPSYLGQNGTAEAMIHGVNYASGAAGIIFSSGSELGQRISLTHQIQQFTDSYQLFILSMGEEAAFNLISSSIFYFSIGVNDFIHYYLHNVSNVQNVYLPWGFNQLLASMMRQEIKNLYNMGVRKIVVMGLPPIGCAPYYLWRYNSQNEECIQEINDIVMEFNFVMRYMIKGLGQELLNTNITFCDMYEGSMDIIKNHVSYGFNVTSEACCGIGKYRGWMLCLAPEMACTNASNHIWWDQYHPTDAVNSILADNVWDGLHTKMCYPMNLKDMVATNA